jgi:ubiquinone/menaquinone biosynthesis C-methylase UbiE
MSREPLSAAIATGSAFRRDDEPPPVIQRLGWKYHHIGIPTKAPREGEKYIAQYKMYVSGFSRSPFGYEWMRFEPDCPLSAIIQTLPHVAFEVADIDAALEGLEVLSPPGVPSEGVRSAMVMHNGAPVELIEFKRGPLGGRAGKAAAVAIDRDVARFDRWAESYDRSVVQRYFFVPIHRRLLALIAEKGTTAPPATVIDVGCGTGRLLRRASLLWPEAELIGVDPAERMVSETVRLGTKARIELGTAEALPFGDQCADLVMSSMSFHHWADQGRGIREIYRVLRPGGLFCLADHSFPLAMLTREKVRSRSQIRALVSAAGFTVIAQKNAGLPFLPITLARK